jgi:hypothetical protein
LRDKTIAKNGKRCKTGKEDICTGVHEIAVLHEICVHPKFLTPDSGTNILIPCRSNTKHKSEKYFKDHEQLEYQQNDRDDTSKMSRKPYRRHTKSAHNRVRDRAFEAAISKSIAVSKAANLPRLGYSRGKIPPRKSSVHLANGSRRRMSHVHMESSTPAAAAIPSEELLSSLAQYCLTERMIRAVQREPGFAELEFRAHQM